MMITSVIFDNPAALPFTENSLDFRNDALLPNADVSCIVVPTGVVWRRPERPISTRMPLSTALTPQPLSHAGRSI